MATDDELEELKSEEADLARRSSIAAKLQLLVVRRHQLALEASLFKPGSKLYTEADLQNSPKPIQLAKSAGKVVLKFTTLERWKTKILKPQSIPLDPETGRAWRNGPQGESLLAAITQQRSIFQSAAADHSGAAAGASKTGQAKLPYKPKAVSKKHSRDDEDDNGDGNGDGMGGAASSVVPRSPAASSSSRSRRSPNSSPHERRSPDSSPHMTRQKKARASVSPSDTA